MSLTAEDLSNINVIVTSVVTDVVTDAVAGLATKDELLEAVSGLATKADVERVEARLVASMSLLERDSFARLDDHERRIMRLERKID
jgi:hypothetical protein